MLPGKFRVVRPLAQGTNTILSVDWEMREPEVGLAMDTDGSAHTEQNHLRKKRKKIEVKKEKTFLNKLMVVKRKIDNLEKY